MSASDTLQPEQFGPQHGPWTEVQTRNMDALKRTSDLSKARAAKSNPFGKPGHPALVIKAPGPNW